MTIVKDLCNNPPLNNIAPNKLPNDQANRSIDNFMIQNGLRLQTLICLSTTLIWLLGRIEV